MKGIIQHLRFPFSILLVPTFLFALSYVKHLNINNSILIFLIMHLLVFPSSNAYNSTQDKDKGSIGMIKKPLPVPKNLLFVTWIFDLFSLAISYFIHPIISTMVFLYIIGSRLYSYRKVRLKQYPLLSFFFVILFQGGFTFLIFYLAAHSSMNIYTLTFATISNLEILMPAFVSTFFIAAMYPLTQIYQHQQDQEDGVTTISYVLGIKGTFILSGLCFTSGSVLLLYILFAHEKNELIWAYLLITLPCIIFFIYWCFLSFKNSIHASYNNMFKMNVISCFSFLLFFIYFYIKF
jgi:1,4-dihydroxy-2-naphthoate polyprenyltransferase